MQSLSELVAMGGYGGYVWPAYATAAAVIIGLLAASLRSLRSRERALAALQAASPGRRARAAVQAATLEDTPPQAITVEERA